MPQKSDTRSKIFNIFTKAKENIVEPDNPIGSVPKIELDEFSEIIRRVRKFPNTFKMWYVQMYQYGDMKLLATLNYNLESNNSLSIVSSIEFDKDGEFFVIAGVTKKIKLYNYDAVVNFEGDLHYPVEQLLCNSKIRFLLQN